MSEENYFDEKFYQKIFALNPESNYDAGLNAVYSVVNNRDLHMPDGRYVTMEIIYERYKEYLEYWNVKFGDVENYNYLGKNKKKTVAEFVKDKMYKSRFQNKGDKREAYLFGQHSDEVLHKLLENFKDKLKWKGNATKSEEKYQDVSRDEEKQELPTEEEFKTFDNPPF